MRSAVITRRRRRLRIFTTIAALSCAGFLAAVTYEAWEHRGEVMADVASALPSPAPADVTPVAAPATPRPVYRHSIVPGGAYSRGEVADAMRTDAVVAAHYQHVDLEKVHTKTVTAARAVYVSYRVGNQVYWTKNRVRLSPGETVLTDGNTEIRARCGNLLSDNAQQPVAAEEPRVTLLDQAETDAGSSSMAGARGPDGSLTYVPFLPAWSESSSVAFANDDPMPGAHGVDMPMWFGGASGGVPSSLGSSTGTTGTSLVAPLGGSERGGSNGRGSNGGGGSNDNTGDGNGNGNNGKNDSNGEDGSTGGGGSNGGGGTDEKIVPPFTTTGDVVTDTTDGHEDDVTTVPEPSTLVLLGLGACGVASRAIRR